MKVLIYTEFFNKVRKSGIGKATEHQVIALKENNIEYTLNKKDLKDVDIVHINYYGLGSVLLAKKAHKLNKKVAYHAHSTYEDFRNSFTFSNLIAPLFKKWISYCYKQGDIIITPTTYSKKILDTYNLGRKIEVVSNGIDFKDLIRNKNYRKEFRKKYNIKDNEKVIMSVGLYIKRKGLLDFVKIAEELPQYKFIWFGSCPKIITPKEIKKVLKNHSSNIIFPGYVEQKELIKAYNGCDLFTFMTYEETEGIVLLEAISTKTKLLIRDIPIYDSFKDNEDLYKATTNEEFKEKIKLIVEGKYKDLTENVYKTISDKSIKEAGKKLKSIYESLLEKK